MGVKHLSSVIVIPSARFQTCTFYSQSELLMNDNIINTAILEPFSYFIYNYLSRVGVEEETMNLFLLQSLLGCKLHQRKVNRGSERVN